MFKKQLGFSMVELLIAVVILGAVGFAGWKVASNKKETSKTAADSSQQSAANTCPAQPMMASPADISQATAVLYPGQKRGNDYKAHGGLRFDNSPDNKVTVKAPMDAKLINGSRYLEQGEVQTLLEFSNDCGIKYRFDHLLTLSEKFQNAVNSSLPAALPDDSRTTDFKPAIDVKKGETIATAVGFVKTHNVGFDFGVYDYRTDNGTNPNGSQQARHAVCWLKDWLPADDSIKLLALPGGDSVNGKTSDYC